MKQEFLAQQAPEIQRALNHGFVYLFSPQAIQHFPARQWTKEQILSELENRFAASARLTDICDGIQFAVIDGYPDVTVLIP